MISSLARDAAWKVGVALDAQSATPNPLRLAASMPGWKRTHRAGKLASEPITAHMEEVFNLARGAVSRSELEAAAEQGEQALLVLIERIVQRVHAETLKGLEDLLVNSVIAGSTAAATNLNTKLRVLGGAGSGNFGHGGRPGERGGSGAGGDSERSEKSQIALANHNTFTKQKEAWATGNEGQIVAMVKGTGTDNNRPVDVVAKVGGKTKGIEVKTMLDNKAGKITMRGDALVRKTQWARSNHASLHTVVIDDRKAFGFPHLYSGHRVYYQKGVGSFRVSTMTRVRDGEHLRKLLGGGK